MQEKLRLSFTKLSFYLDCPQRYYYRYVEKRPFYPHTMTRYGSNIHRVIKDFSEAIKEGAVPDRETQKILYEKQWTDVTKDESRNLELKNQGAKQLQDFVEANQETIGNTLFLEKSFNYPLENLVLNGFIDRIDKLEDNKIEIIDYKTGRLRDLYQDDIQLNFYALICRDHLQLNPAKLSLYFLKTNQKTSVEASNTYIAKTRELIFEIADKILSKQFIPNQIPLDNCSICSYNRFCPYSVS